MSEGEFQKQVLQLAELLGWLTYHTYDSRRSQAGFPDLVLVKSGRIVFAELKSQKGRVRAAQQTWLDALMRNDHVETYLWRPDDWDAVVQVLSGGAT